ncbi:hypothetical protein M413DRAFT_10054 [Hebeloma cylindrosporum]|uniref:HTH CENPB-type domain-containing protein n=1 Tax=Hebeloma cylindrosporum TaxID=76867 RepID=A0A0C2YQS9_HEBCY|nr:hypothetical protein M413DRAFT_10054 [Hebeloma cylindrosporum h7]
MDPNASLQQYPPWYLLDSMYRSYPSPAPSDPSPAPRPPPQLDESYPMPADFSQIPSSIGPTRIARRQTSDQKPVIHRRNSPPYQVPNTRAENPYNSYPSPSQIQSPVYNPGTPGSPYNNNTYAHRSRQRSDSLYEHRAPSPAPSSTSQQSSAGPPESSKSRPLKHTKHRLRDADRKEICLYHLSHPHARQEDIGGVFGVERSTISKILKEKDKWLNLTEEETNDPLSKHRPSKFPEVEEEMLKSLQAWADQGTNITDQLIRNRALDIAKSFGISADRFKGSSGWIENFKHRHDIQRGEWLKAVKSSQNAGTHPLSFGPPSSSSSSIPLPPPPAAGVPPTPVIMAYDQRMQGLPSSPSSRDPPQTHEAHASRYQQHHDATQSPLIHASGSTGPTDVMDGSPSSSVHTPPRMHSQLHSIQHSPEDGPDTYTPQPMAGYAHHHHQHHHQAQMYGVVPEPAMMRPPTLQEANDAMDLVIEYLDKVAPVDLLKGNERQAITDVKCALFSLIGGVPYVRPPGSA